MPIIHRTPESDDLVPLCRPRSPIELEIVRSLLESEGIDHFVHNEAFGSLYIGPMIPLFNEQIVMVPRSRLTTARALIAVPQPEDDDPPVEPDMTLLDKLRMTLEVFLLGWIMPSSGRRTRRQDG
jgi:hypothetical protein